MNPSGMPRKQKRNYALSLDLMYSLPDAANRMAVAESQLRRAILLDHLPATEVADDRQYLLMGRDLGTYLERIRPSEEIVFEHTSIMFWYRGPM